MKFTSSQLAKQRNAKSKSTVKAPKPNLKKVASSKAAHIIDEHPESDVKHIIRGIVRNGLKPVQQKSSVSLRLDLDVINWFRAQGPGYQTRMNAVLKAYRDASV